MIKIKTSGLIASLPFLQNRHQKIFLPSSFTDDSSNLEVSNKIKAAAERPASK